MKTNFKLISLLFLIALTSCKKDNILSEYKYADKPIVLTCNTIDSKLYQEALYSFEDDILNFYGKNKPNASLIQAYNQFIRMANYGNIKYEDILSAHSIKVFEALKKDNNLWAPGNNKSLLNYNSTFFNCIANNISDAHLKTTLKALLSTNSMSPKLFGAPLLTKYSAAINDKYLASYIAFELYYAKLFNLDLSKINFEKPEPNVDFNKIPQPINDTSLEIIKK
jgi:hypothetical protein